MWIDLRHAGRRLTRERGLSAAAIITLAVGIGFSAAMFSVVRSVLLRPLGIHAPDRVVVMWPTVNDTAAEFTFNAYRDLERANVTLDGVAVTGSATWPARWVLGGAPVTIHGAAVSATFFDVMGAAPAVGRTFRPGDDVSGARQVVVLSDRLWAQHFNQDPAVVGRAIEVQEEPGTVTYEVVGVMGPNFFHPSGAAYWTPAVPVIARSAAGAPLEPVMEGLGVFHAVGRLKPGESIATLHTDVNRLWRLRSKTADFSGSSVGIRVTSLLDHTFGRARQALVILMTAVLLVLFSACANVAGLLIARGASRAHEVAVRTALGATRWALVREALADGLVLAVPGAIVGVSVAAASLQGLIALSPAAVPRLDTTRLDAGVLVFAAALTAGSAVFLALLPGLSLRRGGSLTIPGAGKGTVGPRSRAGLRHALVTLQMATGVVLLVATGLTMRSFARLASVDTGFHAEHVLTFGVSGLDGTRYPARTQRHDLVERLIEHFGRVPGVEAAAAVLLLPFGAGSIGWDSGLWLEGQGDDANAWQRNPTVNFEIVTPGYFQATGIPLRRGRDFTATDLRDTPPVAIISENLAARLWSGEDPVGKQLMDSFSRGNGTQPPIWLNVVGVVGSAVYREIDRPRFDLYLPLKQATNFDAENFVVKTAGSPRSFVRALGAAAGAVDSTFSLENVMSMDEIIGGVRGPWRFNMLVFSVFGVVSTALTAIGLFGLVSYTVVQRRREFGIRLALGAEGWRIWRIVFRESALLAAIGLTTGVLVSAAATRTIASLLFETSATDGATFIAAVLVLAAVTFLATYLPARRAASTDPAITLRHE